MSHAEELAERYAAELRGYGATLLDDFRAAARELEPRMPSDRLEQWADTAVGLAGRSLRSWEAAGEFVRTSPAVFEQLPFEAVMHWGTVGGRLAETSPLVAAAFLRSTPVVLPQLPPDPSQDPGIMGEGLSNRAPARADIERWARMGERLHRGNWKSIALCSLFFELSPRLLQSMTLHALGELVEVIDLLSERSYQLATTCLESSAELFAGLTAPDREPFLRFARAVTKASWADTRLYFERGPDLIHRIDSEQRAAFLELASRVVATAGRQGFPQFIETATALGEVPHAEHETLLALARRIARGSPLAAMAFLKSSPFVLTRLTTDQLGQWVEPGNRLLFEEGNPEGAEAYFRLESVRAEQVLGALSARVELSSVGGLLRLYAQALTGEAVAIRSTEELVEKGIGWVAESMATTEGSAIYLPPFVGSFPEQASNFQCYKVFTTHQTGRIEFGSFGFRFGVPGALTPATIATREASALPRNAAAVTDMERYYDIFAERALIAALLTIAEDTRVDAYVSREYGGVRAWLRRLQSYEAERRPNIRELPMRAAFAENLLRASLGRRDTIRWRRDRMPTLVDAIAALAMVEQSGATVQDSAEVAAALYDLAMTLPNVVAEGDEEEWLNPEPELDTIIPSMPGGKGGEEAPTPHGEEAMFQAPPQPEFRGDYKPELVQLLMRLKQQQPGGQGGGTPLTREQLMELLQKSSEITISEIAEGDFASSMGLFLSNLEKEAATPAGSNKQGQQTDGQEQPGAGPDDGDLPIEIEWTYYDEWDFRAADYRPRWCRVGERPAEEGGLEYYEETLRRHHSLVSDTRRQFELMRPESFRRIKKLEDGEEIDLDRSIEFLIDKRAGAGPLAQVYWRRNKVERDVAVAFLLDMSASTDEEIEKQRLKEYDDDDFDGDPRNYFQWLARRRARFMSEPPKRIVDLEKESLVLIVEALEAIGDAYGIYGFSGYGRDNVEFHVIKDLEERFGERVRKRIDKIQPIRSTRMGPAIRHTISKLQSYDAKAKLLILVSDGRPQDHGYGRDRTEKEYAVHDTHQALVEAKRSGITPFLITVDKEGHDYLGQMCSDVGYEVVDDIEQLPRRLTSLYKVLATE